MADNSTALQGTLDSLNVTNATSPASGPAAESPAFLDFLLLEVQLVGSAIGIIYLGAHAALRRPPSAAKRQSRPGKKHKHADDEVFSQGLMPSDAIIFPILAGVMLVGLYYLIQYLKNPDILNKILRWYMSIMSTASLVTMCAHGLDLATSFVFPSYWRGNDGKLRKVEQKTKSVILCDDAGNSVEGTSAESNPLPGLLAWIVPTRAAKDLTWKARALLKQHFYVKLYARKVGRDLFQIRFSHLCAVVMALATTVTYFSTKSPFLSNILGHAMCYGSFILLSPTDLLTSTLVLMGLFFYDIVMVFYTPYMITVATTLDVPIKLQFEAASKKSMLGLGDIVIPGMVMAWALRLDLWLHYQRKIKYESTPLSLVEKAADGSIKKTSQVKHKEVKAPYVNVKGNWGERFWTRGLLFLAAPKVAPPTVRASTFSKTYFTASLVGYLLGMLVTLAMLLIFQHGQPALLYLVPGVLGSLYITAFARGEFTKVWSYTEDGSLDMVDMVVELDLEGKAVKSIGTLESGIVDTTKSDKPDEKKDKDKNKNANRTGDKETSDSSNQGTKGARIEDDEGPGDSGKHRCLVSMSIDLPSDDDN